MGRKNWLFSDTPKGAKASADIYSIVETAKTNGLDVFKYFELLLTVLPSMEFLTNPDILEELLQKLFFDKNSTYPTPAAENMKINLEPRESPLACAHQDSA